MECEYDAMGNSSPALKALTARIGPEGALDLLHRRLAPAGIRVAQVLIVGPVGPGLAHEPDAVAEALWQAHQGRGSAVTVLEPPAS